MGPFASGARFTRPPERLTERAGARGACPLAQPMPCWWGPRGLGFSRDSCQPGFRWRGEDRGSAQIPGVAGVSETQSTGPLAGRDPRLAVAVEWSERDMGGAMQKPIGQNDPELFSEAKESQYFDRKSARIRPSDAVRHVVALSNAAGGSWSSASRTAARSRGSLATARTPSRTSSRCRSSAASRSPW